MGSTETTAAELLRGARIDPRLEARCAIRDDDMDALTDCLRKGPLTASQIKLVGLVDPREVGRATEVGIEHAAQLKSALARRGVPPELCSRLAGRGRSAARQLFGAEIYAATFIVSIGHSPPPSANRAGSQEAARAEWSAATGVLRLVVRAPTADLELLLLRR